jgi:P27 family predicted phage terminase small subunit
MGKRGRIPQPPHLTVIRGNPGKRAIRQELAPAIPEFPPDPPEWLTGAAADEWRRIAPELHRLGLLTVLDVMPFAAYCTSLALWREAERLLTSTDGSLADSPRARLVRIARGAMADAMKFGAMFGIGPPWRVRLTSTRPRSKFDGLLA